MGKFSSARVGLDAVVRTGGHGLVAEGVAFDAEGHGGKRGKRPALYYVHSQL